MTVTIRPAAWKRHCGEATYENADASALNDLLKALREVAA